MKPAIIYIDGIPGAGKTSLLHSIKAAMGDAVAVHEEEVDQERLSQMLRNMKKHAASYQFHRLLESAKLLRTAITEAQAGKGVVIDRSVAGDAAFAWNHYRSGNISETEWATYKKNLLFFRQKQEEIGNDFPITHLYIKISAANALTRIKKRGRPGESTYTEEYLEGVHDAHLALYDQLSVLFTTIVSEDEHPLPSKTNPDPGRRFIAQLQQ